MNCHIEIFRDGRWVKAATFEPENRTLDRGVDGGGWLQYDIDYAVAHLGERAAELIPGLTVGFELFSYKQWPPVLVDLLPGGAGRRAWLRRMQIERDGPQMDWHLLVKGAGAPPGNLRISEAVPSPPSGHFRLGFHRRAIIEQGERFLDYAEERGAYVAGASSVQGEAPKYLFVEAHDGRFHAEGAMPDEKARKFWLVKFPRGRHTDIRNQQVLRNEAAYLEVARSFGVRVGEPLVYEGGALFVPRFDRRVSDGRVERLGMNSLYAVANIPRIRCCGTSRRLLPCLGAGRLRSCAGIAGIPAARHPEPGFAQHRQSRSECGHSKNWGPRGTFPSFRLRAHVSGP